MFGQIGRRTAHQARELDLAIVVALALVTGVVALFVIADPFGGSPASGARSARSPVMLGHGMVMPHQVTVHAAKGELAVAMGDFWFKPSSVRLHAGVYKFTAHNYGVTPHDVMVERVPIKFSGPGQPIDEAAPYGIDGTEPGMTQSTKIGLTAGRWELFCSVSGHYMAGQHKVITVYGRMPRGMHVPKMGMDEDETGSGHMDDDAGTSGSMGMS